MSRLKMLKDALWFGELLAGSLNKGGITRGELAQQWRTSGLEDDERSFSRDVFRNILQAAEEYYDCCFICDRRTNRWIVDGNTEDEQRFLDKVRLLRAFFNR